MASLSPNPFRAAVAWVATDVLVRLVEALPEAEAERTRAWARAELERLPRPAFPSAGRLLEKTRTRLDILLGALEARSGRDERLLEAARREWVEEGRHAVYLRVLEGRGRADHAIRLALSIIAEPAPHDPQVLAFLREALALPVGAEAHLLSVAARPTRAGVDALVRFAPKPLRDHRRLYVAHRLRALGVEPEVLCPLLAAARPDGVLDELAITGEVAPATLAALGVAEGHDGAGYLALASRAASVRGEGFLAVRYLREARARGREPGALSCDVLFVSAHADGETHRALARSGFPAPLPEAN